MCLRERGLDAEGRQDRGQVELDNHLGCGCNFRDDQSKSSRNCCCNDGDDRDQFSTTTQMSMREGRGRGTVNVPDSGDNCADDVLNETSGFSDDEHGCDDDLDCATI